MALIEQAEGIAVTTARLLDQDGLISLAVAGFTRRTARHNRADPGPAVRGYDWRRLSQRGDTLSHDKTCGVHPGGHTKRPYEWTLRTFRRGECYRAPRGYGATDRVVSRPERSIHWRV